VRRPIARQNEFNQLRDRAGLTAAEAASLLSVSDRTVARYVAGTGQPSPLAMRVLREAGRKTPETGDASSFRFIDLFAGIGGLRIGFQGIGGHCVFTSEWDANAQKTYAVNFRDNHPLGGDIREYAKDPSLIPEHDVLLGGFPCQPFSIAGVSKKNALGRPHGFLCDTQGTLFFDTAQIIAHHRPAAFVLENVKNLESHDKRRTFATIMNVLQNELGYHVQTRVISSEHWVPQRRERIFIVGFRDPNDFTFADLELPDPFAGPRLGTILHPEDGTEELDAPYTRGNIASVSEKYTLTDHLWRYLQGYAAKHKAAGNGFGFGLVGPGDVARTLSARYYKDGSEILVEQKRKNPRRLTPRECARLMGFDEPSGRDFIIPVSDTQAYRQFGNAVVVPVVKAVAAHMMPWLVDGADAEPEQPERIMALAG
jgi:DNA (cytosine-5)-methyltransferase 1